MSDFLKKLKESLDSGDTSKIQEFGEKMKEIDKKADEVDPNRIKDVVENIDLGNDNFDLQITESEKAYLAGMQREEAVLKVMAKIENTKHAINKMVEEKKELVEQYDKIISDHELELESLNKELDEKKEIYENSKNKPSEE